MLFADESRNNFIEENLEDLRRKLENVSLKLGRSKTDYLPLPPQKKQL